MSWRKFLYSAFVVLVAGMAGLFGALAGGLGVYVSLQRSPAAVPAIVNPTSPTPLPTNPPVTLQVNTINVETAITQMVAKVGPSVVTVVGQTPEQQSFFGTLSGATVTGSGVIISDKGFILTNHHVVEGVRADKLIVVLADGKELPARLVGSDLFSDLAVLKIEGQVPAVAMLGNSDALLPGETVVAMGSPLGDFKNTVTVGVVSATGRNLDTGNGYLMEGLIQTDAAINSGNSGGPLLNLAGQVIGINTLIVRIGQGGNVVEGLGFAIPSNTVKAIAGQLIDQGQVARPSLGIRWQPVDPNLAAQYSLPVEWGVYVAQLESGGAAEKAGVQEGDIITAIGNTPIDGDHPFINTLFNYKPGDKVNLTVARGSTKIQIEVTLQAANT